jgi:hypothetical protein
MKKLALILAVAVLGGCAVQQPAPAYYGTRAYPQSGDPSQWQVVSVTPVPAGTGASAGAQTTTTEYSAAPVAAAPVYVPQPVYVPAPVYVPEPYWYPPISIGLGFNFGRGWGGHHGGWGRGHFGGRHR